MKTIKPAMAICALWCAALSLTLSGCVSTTSKTGGDGELDMAILEASDYLNANVPKGNKLAIISVKSDYPSLSEYIIDTLTANIVNDRLFTVVERGQLDAIRAELDFNLSGEVDDNSAQAIGKMLGAQTIVIGSVSPIGNNWRMSIRALAVENAEVQGLYNRNIPNTGTIAALTTGQKAASGGTKTSPLGALVQALPQPIGPKNGTYVFANRPQAEQNGVPKDIYIAKIVINDDWMTFYFEDRAEGGGGYGRWGTVYWEARTTTLFNLDDTTKYIALSNKTGNQAGNVVTVVFPRFNATRFRLENTGQGEANKLMFRQIDLNAAIYSD